MKRAIAIVSVFLFAFTFFASCKNATEKTKTTVKTDVKKTTEITGDDSGEGLQDMPLKPGGENPPKEVIEGWKAFEPEKVEINTKNWQATKKLINKLVVAIEQFKANNKAGLYPEAGASENGKGTETLVQLIEDGLLEIDASKNIKELTKQIASAQKRVKVLVDAWGRPLQYVPWANAKDADKSKAKNPKNFDLWSAGPDASWNTADDVTNW